MNKGSKKATSYFIMALFVLSTTLPVISEQHKDIKWLVTAATISVMLWRGRDYLEKGDSEDEGDKAIGTTKDTDKQGDVSPL